MQASFNYFSRGRKQLERATGQAFHWNVAKMVYKLAGHYMMQDNWNRAQYATITFWSLHLHKLTFFTSKLLIQCEEYYKTASHYTPMRARVQYHLSRTYAGQRKLSQARDARFRAWELRKSLRPHDERGPEQLKGKDFDDLVVFWCR